MSDPIIPGSSPPAAVGEPQSAPTPADEIVAQFMAAISAATKLVPGFQREHPEAARLVRQFRGFNTKAIPAAITAVEENPELAAGGFNLARARTAVQYRIAFPSAVNQVKTLGRDLQFTVDLITALALEDSLTIYAVAKAYGRSPSGAKVAAHASNIKRVLRRPPTRKKADKTTPSTPAPAPVPTPKAAS